MMHMDQSRKTKKGRRTTVNQSQMIMQLRIPETLNTLNTHLLLKLGKQNVTVLLVNYVNVMGLPTQLYSTVYGQKCRWATRGMVSKKAPPYPMCG